MKKLIFLAPLMLLLNFIVSAADEVDAEPLKKQPVDPDIIESCRIEGQSMSYKDKDLEIYIEECLEDFADTDLDITPTS